MYISSSLLTMEVSGYRYVQVSYMIRHMAANIHCSQLSTLKATRSSL